MTTELELSGTVRMVKEDSFTGKEGNPVPTFTATIETTDGEFVELQAFTKNPFTKGESLEAVYQPNSNPKYPGKYLRRKGEAPKAKSPFTGSGKGSREPEDKSGVTAGMLTNKAVEAVLAGQSLNVDDIVREGLKILEANKQILNAVRLMKAKEQPTPASAAQSSTTTQRLPNEVM